MDASMDSGGIDIDPRRDALFLDLDGTMLDIAPTPDAVTVAPGLPETIDTVFERFGGAVAILTGRPVARVDMLFPFRGPVAGGHGTELRLAIGEPIEHPAPELPVALTRAVGALGQLPGVLIENKGFTIAVHYRNAPYGTSEAIRRVLVEQLVDQDGAHLTMVSGKSAYELKPARFSKGTALARILALPAFTGRRPVVVGDDVTDEDAFDAARERGGFAIAVGLPRPGADATFDTPADVRNWLDRLAGAA